MNVRLYNPSTDEDALWDLKRAFELSLGDETGGDAKAKRYREKLSAGYREAYLAWVKRCVDETPDCVQVADDSGTLVGYAFILPESFAYIWDAAVLNEIFVSPPYRGAGVADDLLDAVLTVARRQTLPLDRIVLDVDQNNTAAHSFYARRGFEHWGEMLALPLE